MLNTLPCFQAIIVQFQEIGEIMIAMVDGMNQQKAKEEQL